MRPMTPAAPHAGQHDRYGQNLLAEPGFAPCSFYRCFDKKYFEDHLQRVERPRRRPLSYRIEFVGMLNFA